MEQHRSSSLIHIVKGSTDMHVSLSTDHVGECANARCCRLMALNYGTNAHSRRTVALRMVLMHGVTG